MSRKTKDVSKGEILKVWVIDKNDVDWKKTEATMPEGQSLLTGGTIGELVMKRKYGKRTRKAYEITEKNK